MHTLQTTWQKLSAYNLAPLCLIVLFFVEPLSSTAKSIFLGLSVLAIIFTPHYRENLSAVFRKPWSLLATALFFLALLASFWSPASMGEKWLVIEKYSKFVYLPLLTLGFTEADTRRKAIHAFLAGMLLTGILSILQSKNIIPGGQVNADAVFRNHIMTGIMMSFAAYLSAFLLFPKQNSEPLCVCINLFAVQLSGSFYQHRTHWLCNLSLINGYLVLSAFQQETGPHSNCPDSGMLCSLL